MRELWKISGGRFVPHRNKTFDAIVQPIGWQMLFICDAAGKVANDLRWLKDRINIFRRRASGKSEHHDCAPKQTDFTSDTLFAEFIGQSVESSDNLFPRQGYTGLVFCRAHCRRAYGSPNDFSTWAFTATPDRQGTDLWKGICSGLPGGRSSPNYTIRKIIAPMQFC